jgi:Fic family protein
MFIEHLLKRQTITVKAKIRSTRVDIRHFRSGTFRQQEGYVSFLPRPIDLEWIVSSPEVATMLAEANQRIGELNAISEYVPNINLFVTMLIAKEATSSNAIEGTRTTIEEALREEKDIAPERHDDWEAVQDYILAMNVSIDRLKDIPLSSRLLCEAHAILFDGIDHQHKRPGEFRRSQNWIGGATLRDAQFIPPDHLELVTLMSDLEKFLHNTTIHVPHLVRIAIAHYQFETIHPFLEGNGRIGRLMITLYLISTGVLRKPTLYLSEFFERNRMLYYDNLERTRRHNDMEAWMKFFLVGVIETAERSIGTFRKVLALKDEMDRGMLRMFGRRSVDAAKLFKYLYAHPTIRATDVESVLGLTPASANSMLRTFVKESILKEQTGWKRNRVYTWEEYLRCFADNEQRR